MNVLSKKQRQAALAQEFETRAKDQGLVDRINSPEYIDERISRYQKITSTRHPSKKQLLQTYNL